MGKPEGKRPARKPRYRWEDNKLDNKFNLNNKFRGVFTVMLPDHCIHFIYLAFKIPYNFNH